MSINQTRLRGPAALAVLVFAISFVVAMFMLVVSMAAPTSTFADDVAPATLATVLVIDIVAMSAIAMVMRRPDETPMISLFCLAFDGTKIVLDYVAIAVNWTGTVVFKRQTLAVNTDDPGGGTSTGGNHGQMTILGFVDGRHDDVPIDHQTAMRWDKVINGLLGGAVNRATIRNGGHEMFGGQPALAGT